jgi:tetratricopeptide (TPR) repeat protein
MTTVQCPQCFELATYSKKRSQFYCSECEFAFDPPVPQIEPQTIFFSYAHKSEHSEDYDVSEELVWLIKEELEKDGHKIWIDHEGITAGAQWRERITSAILGHTHFLSFLSKRSVRDPGVCLNEIAIALGNGRQIQTLLTESEEAVRQPLTISHLQWHQFVGWKAIKEGQKTGPKCETWDDWFGERMALIRENLSDAHHQKVAGDLQRLKEILEPRTFEADIVKSIEGFYGRQWLFEACEQWLNTSTKRLFWLKGSPGIGKSSFAAKLVHISNSAIVGFFKCEFQGSKSPEESAGECIRTLAYQLAARLPDYRMKLLYQQLIDKVKISKKTADDLFTYLITEPLNISGKIPEATRLALVIDALDEAGRNDGTNSLADLIYKHADKLPPWLGIIVTSRPEPYLEQQLGKFESTPIEGDTEKNLKDLRDYLNERLDPSIENPRRGTIIEQVIEKSGGTFLYLKFIEKDKTLDFAKPETLPKGIDDVFMRDFKRYFPNPKEYGQETEPFLRLMAAAPGPLSINLAKDLLVWTSRDITTKVTQPLGSLLQEKNGGLVFFHKSILDWLQDPKRSGLYQVDDSGAKELGNFLWKEFEKGDPSQWQSQVLEWLPRLLPSTEYWSDRESLSRFALVLGKNFKYTNTLMLREKILELTSIKFGEISIEAVRDRKELALAYRFNAYFGEAENAYKLALKACNELEVFDEIERAKSLDSLGGFYLFMDNFPEAEKFLLEAYEAKSSSLGTENASTAKTLSNLGILYQHIGMYSESEKYHLLALEIKLRCKVDDGDLARSYNGLGTVAYRQGDLPKAEEYFIKAILLGESAGSLEGVAGRLINLGTTQKNNGKMEAAGLSLDRALNIYLDIYGNKHPTFAIALKHKAVYLLDIQKLEESKIAFEQSIEILNKFYGSTHPQFANALNDFSLLLIKMELFELARKYLHIVYEIYLNIYGSQHRLIAVTLHNFGYVNYKDGKYDEALKYLTDSYRLKKKLLGNFHHEMSEILNALAYCYSKKENHHTAVKYAYKNYILARRKSDQNPALQIEALLTAGEIFQNASLHENSRHTYKFASDECSRLGISSGELYGRVMKVHNDLPESSNNYLT